MNKYYDDEFSLLENNLLELYSRYGLTDEILKISSFIDKIFNSKLEVLLENQVTSKNIK